MWANFNFRSVYSRNLPNILTGGTPENGSPEDMLVWLKVLIGYTTTLPKDLDDEDKWPLLPDGISRNMAGQKFEDEEIRKKFAQEAVDAWFTPKLVQRSLSQILDKHRDDPEKFSKLSVVYPSTYSDEFSANHIPAAIGKKIKAYLDKRMPNAVLPLEVCVQENEIFTVSKASRGVPKHSEPQNEREKRYFWGIHRIAGQPLIRGEVEREAIYWLVDDGTTIGSTMCNHLCHIQNLGGTVGAVTCLTKRYNGAEILKPQPESIEFLMAAMRQNFIDNQRNIGMTIGKWALKEDAAILIQNYKDLECKLGSIGISLSLAGGWWDKPFSPKKVCSETTATNQEILILGSYFMNPENKDLWKLLDKALKSTGSSIKEATDSYPVKLASAKPGHIMEFEDLVDFAIVNSRQFVIGSEQDEVPGKGSIGVSATFSSLRFLHSLGCDYSHDVVLDR